MAIRINKKIIISSKNEETCENKEKPSVKEIIDIEEELNETEDLESIFTKE